MHSKIFQISSKPIDEDDYISCDKYCDNESYTFVNAIADYVDDLTDEERAKCIEWLKDCYEGTFEIDGDKVTVINKEKYFERKYNKFSTLLEHVKDMSFEKFCTSEMSMTIRELAWEYDDEYGFYIDDNGEYFGLATMDTFMRKANNGDVFYIGAVIDYHF